MISLKTAQGFFDLCKKIKRAGADTLTAKEKRKFDYVAAKVPADCRKYNPRDKALIDKALRLKGGTIAERKFLWAKLNGIKQ